MLIGYDQVQFANGMMLKRLFSQAPSSRTENFPRITQPGGLELGRVLPAARRQFFIVFLTLPLGLLFGVAYLYTAAPRYTASTDVLINGQKDKMDLSTSLSEMALDTGAIDSQVEVLKSKKIALAVVDALDLTHDPDVMDPPGGLARMVTEYVKGLAARTGFFRNKAASEPPEEGASRRFAADQLEENLAVQRVAHTYVLSLSYTAGSPSRAARIANAFAEAYLNEQLTSKFDAARRAAEWLEGRLAELRKKSLDSDSAVQKFKADKGLVETGGDKPSLISDQQLNAVNEQIASARADTAKAEARYSQIEELLKSGRLGAIVPDSLSDPIINDLRQKYMTAMKTESQLESTLGPNHVQVINLNKSMQEYERQISDELQHIAESYRSDAEVARAKEQSLVKSMSGLVDANVKINQTMVQLRELERESESYRTLYETFLQRYQATLQEQSSPVAEAQVITSASPPEAPSAPRRGTVLMLSGILGLMAAAGVGALREYRDTMFRAGWQVREELGLEYLGALPMLRRLRGGQKKNVPAVSGIIDTGEALLRYCVDQPMSSFSETLSAAKVAVDSSVGERLPKIVGVTSMLPDEGKTTVSKNFASLLAILGARVLLVDGDLRSPGLTRKIASHAREGLLEAIRGDRPLDDLLLFEPESGLSVLPAVISKPVRHSGAILSSAGMRNVLAEAGASFDYVVVDLPPLGPVVDVRAAAPYFDAFLFVVEWGKTPQAVVRNCLVNEATLGDKCVGVIFNKTDMKKLHLYEDEGSKEMFYPKYAKYYRSEKAQAEVDRL